MAQALLLKALLKEIGPTACLAQLLKSLGEPSRDRTEDPLIKSQVLFQLS
jgi:hypothetical protein